MDEFEFWITAYANNWATKEDIEAAVAVGLISIDEGDDILTLNTETAQAYQY